MMVKYMRLTTNWGHIYRKKASTYEVTITPDLGFYSVVEICLATYQGDKQTASFLS